MRRTLSTTTSWASRLAAVVIALSASAWAQEHSVRPGINEPFEKGTSYQKFIDQFEREGREIFDKRMEILDAVGLQSGMTVADIGAGSGLFVALFARAVGASGRVYAVDITPVMVNNILRRAREAGLNNVAGEVNSAKSLPLPPASLDVAFTSDVYHHFEYPQIMLRAIRRALKPGGVFVVVDFERIPGVSSERILSHVRAGKETVIQEVEAEGFRRIEEKKLLEFNYFIRFQKQ